MPAELDLYVLGFLSRLPTFHAAYELGVPVVYVYAARDDGSLCRPWIGGSIDCDALEKLLSEHGDPDMVADSLGVSRLAVYCAMKRCGLIDRGRVLDELAERIIEMIRR